MVETLNEISQLRDSGFGQPQPRHGLKLLYWFANECIRFENNNEMRSKYDPDKGYFGFHPFKNRDYHSGERLLPDVDIPYYVVGNLNSPGAYQLPSYVKEDYSTHNDDSNTDRIIISLDDDDWIKNVYVTEHIDNSNFDPDATFRISKGLLIIFRSNTLDNLLWKTGFAFQPQRPVADVFPLPFPVTIQQPFNPVTTLNPVVSPASPTPLQQQFDKERPPTSNPALVSVASPSPIRQNLDKGPPPTAQTNDTTIQIEPDVNKHKSKVSENHPYRNKTFWDMCAIL